jgi:hypothetical protein
MTKKKDGRNKPNKNSLKDIDGNQVETLAGRFWTKSEIAAFMNCHVDTITNRFQEIYLKGKENGKAKLRDLQLKSAMSGNVTMQIWLGKQYLGQSDKQENEVIMPNKITIKLPDALNGN